jgi:hypothetical protein
VNDRTIYVHKSDPRGRAVVALFERSVLEGCTTFTDPGDAYPATITLDRHPVTLSSGEARLWSVALSIVGVAPVMLDDVFNHIDAESASAVVQAMLILANADSGAEL